MNHQKFHNFAVGGVAILTSLSILWAVYEFIIKRNFAEKMNLSHEIDVVEVVDNRIWVRVESIIENIGETRIKVDEIAVSLQQITPLMGDLAEEIVNNPESFADVAVFPWPVIGSHQMEVVFVLEPGEKHFVANEFVLPDDIGFIKIETFAPSGGAEPDFGRTVVTIFDLREAQ